MNNKVQMCFISLCYCELLIVVNLLVAIIVRLAEIPGKNTIPFALSIIRIVFVGNYLPDNQKNFYKTYQSLLKTRALLIGIRF